MNPRQSWALYIIGAILLILLWAIILYNLKTNFGGVLQ